MSDTKKTFGKRVEEWDQKETSAEQTSSDPVESVPPSDPIPTSSPTHPSQTTESTGRTDPLIEKLSEDDFQEHGPYGAKHHLELDHMKSTAQFYPYFAHCSCGFEARDIDLAVIKAEVQRHRSAHGGVEPSQEASLDAK